MSPDLERIIVDRERIAARVRELSARIEHDLASDPISEPDDSSLVLVPVLTGAMIFVADLIRHLPRRLRISAMTASSYPGTATRSQGHVELGEMPRHLAGQDVIIVDDILDSGRTLAAIRDALSALEPRSLRTCVLLRKDVARAVPVEADYVGFDIPDEFVVGYGLDYDGLYRNLPDIGVLREDKR
ncbi:MAG: hypoxanthine phosphoribosyltransferase [Phycisphaerales bacterium]